MKKILSIIIFVLISFAVIAKAGGELPICNSNTVKQDFVPTSFEQITMDGNRQSPIVTRFFHNKIGLFGNALAICYFNVLEPLFLLEAVGIAGIVGLLSFAYTSAVRKYWPLLVVFLLVPLLPFISSSLGLAVIIYKFFAIIGLAFLTKLR